MPTALVTGATAGIGRAIALALARDGYAVGVCARTAAAVEALVAELRREGVRASGRAGDVGDEHDVSAIVRQVTAELGAIDTLVNNAGILIAKPLEELSLADWDLTMRTNLRSLYLTTREVLPEMRRRRRGAIVNVASLAGKTGLAGGTAYSASKHAVLGFSRSLMLEVRRDNIRVIAVCPGSVATGMMRDQPVSATRPEKMLAPEDVAEAVLGALRLPERALVSELDLRPTNPA